MISDPTHGTKALLRGAQLLTRRELRPFILVPLLINVLLFVAFGIVIISQLGSLSSYLGNLLADAPIDTAGMPWWQSMLAAGAAWAAGVFHWLAWLIALVVLLLFLLFYGYMFAVVTNIIAAPFNGFLAEKVEELLTGKAPPPEALRHMVLRTLKRELQKLKYFIGWGLVILLITLFTSWTVFIPALLSALWGAWCMAIQYVDYPLDNHQRPFSEVKGLLLKHKLTTLSFGGTILLVKMIPIVNILVMPAAVAGGTALWIEQLQQHNKGELT